MADLNATKYRKELRMFRGALTNVAANPATSTRRTLKGAGFAWYNVYEEPTLDLYIELKGLYLKAFRNPAGCYKFWQVPDPVSAPGTIINATQLPFSEHYNKRGPTDGLGLDQDRNVTVTLSDVGMSLGVMASGSFGTKTVSEQKLCIARVVIALIEGARFKDMENAIVAGTPIPDRKWGKHENSGAILIAPP